ncbi:LOW QUALITY PROTEIN: hypothetical protein OSB04_022950 [Centaurea solstitialis]|uniref:Protein kinase domain-containing protein n=1 Tax=Centaurea solstitialis TaxID=347529 RepID=A0AA38SQQ5_9ASTR|nr:LOW QUALITY PROTEIN: hypothetical protein OSB04_022950 [Centaurea solstitialis]
MEIQIGSLRHFHKQDPANNTEEPRAYCSFHNVFILLTTLLILSSHLVSVKASSDDNAMAVTLSDYSSLQAIRQEIVDFRGVLRTWKDRNGVCSGGWIGIKCDRGQVIAIQLPWKGLGGKISSKIGNLHSLKRISLHDNLLSGPIPNSIWLLPNLRGVYLFNNRLSGSIPPSISQCPSLQNLDLSNNQLNGSIPHILSNSTKIYRFNLSHNAFSGFIPPSLTLLPSLTFLAIEHNSLSGSIPNTWGLGRVDNNQSFQLTSLTLDHNFLTGKIPTSLGKMGNLEKIDLGHNHMDGVIPEEFGGLSKLRVLDLSNNGINGSFPSFASSNNLSVLVLDNNRLSGPIPDSVGNLSSLTKLSLSHNNFSGGIPKTVVGLKNLVSLNVSYNALSGSVPSSLVKKFNSSSFVGNLQLCGYSVSTPCPSSSSISPSPSQVLPSPTKKHENRKLSTKDIILIAAGALLLVLLLLCCLLLCCLVRKKSARSKKGKTDISMPIPAVAAGGEVVESGETGGKLVHFSGTSVFTADDLLCATAEIMGKSTYGTSYKATLEDGNMVAVKRLREKVTKAQKEFEAEVSELGKIRHANVLALRAYYLGPKGEKLLVTWTRNRDKLANKIEHHRGNSSRSRFPSYRKQHGPREPDFEQRVTRRAEEPGDCGRGSISSHDECGQHERDCDCRDFGYRAPEFSKLKNANTKTDPRCDHVGAVDRKVAERVGDGLDLPQWVASIVKEEWTNEVFDLELMGDPANVGSDELLSTLKLAMHCVDPSPEERPEAQQVVEKLEEIKPELAAARGGDDGGSVVGGRYGGSGVASKSD